MKTTFTWISSILIVILIGVLLWFVINYYNKPVTVMQQDEISTSDIIDSSKIVDGSNDADIISSTNSTPEIKDQKENIIPNDNEGTKSIIIESDSRTSDRDKQQILNELDDALMDLLDVVDKVQTVDETKLIVDSESEVQQ